MKWNQPVSFLNQYPPRCLILPLWDIIQHPKTLLQHYFTLIKTLNARTTFKIRPLRLQTFSNIQPYKEAITAKAYCMQKQSWQDVLRRHQHFLQYCIWPLRIRQELTCVVLQRTADLWKNRLQKTSSDLLPNGKVSLFRSNISEYISTSIIYIKATSEIIISKLPLVCCSTKVGYGILHVGWKHLLNAVGASSVKCLRQYLLPEFSPLLSSPF